MRRDRGFTLLEMIVATTIMAVAIVGLISGLSTTTHNAARLRDYDRAVQLGRERMNELMLDQTLPHNTVVAGVFDPNQTGGVEAGWKARLTTFVERRIDIDTIARLPRRCRQFACRRAGQAARLQRDADRGWWHAAGRKVAARFSR